MRRLCEYFCIGAGCNNFIMKYDAKWCSCCSNLYVCGHKLVTMLTIRFLLFFVASCSIWQRDHPPKIVIPLRTFDMCSFLRLTGYPSCIALAIVQLYGFFWATGGHLPIWPAKMEPREWCQFIHVNVLFQGDALSYCIREYVTLEGITLKALAAVWCSEDL